MDELALHKPSVREDSRPRRSSKPDEVTSILSSDSLILFRERYHFPNDLIVRLPSKSENVCSPPAGYISVYEMSLQAGIRFPPAPELTAILTTCGICISQFYRRAAIIVMGLTAFFRERGSTLTPEILSKICRFLPDLQGRISCRSKWLDFQVTDTSKNWSSRFFFVKNEWDLREKWGELQDLPSSLGVGEEDVLRLLNLSKREDLQYEVRYLSRFVNEESLFKMKLSFHDGRSYATKLKTSSKAGPSLTKRVISRKPQQTSQDDEPLTKKKKIELPQAPRKNPSASPDMTNKFHVPEEMLKHSCLGLRQSMDLIARKKDLDLELHHALKEWNTEFIKIKYLQGEYMRRYKEKTKEMVDLENQLSSCRSELANLISSLSSQSREVDIARGEVMEAQDKTSQVKKYLKIAELKTQALEVENSSLSAMLKGKAVKSDAQVIQDFKDSMDFKMIIQERIQQERDYIHNVEVKSLEKQSFDEGFVRGFLKTTRLVQRKTGADIGDLSPSQISSDPPSDSEDDAVSAPESPGEEIDIVTL